MTKPKPALDPMEELQVLSVTVKLGQTHFEALKRWSKERFGLPNQAGFLRLMVNERLQSEQLKAKTVEAGRE